MYKIGWKVNYFMSSDLSMLGCDCGVSSLSQFYDKIKNKYKISPRPYVESYEGEKGRQFLK